MALALVTGGNGFLGRYVCREILRCGDSVVCVSRAPGLPNAETLIIPAQPTAEDLREILDHVQPSVVYHLAGTSQMADVPLLYQANVLFAEALLKAAAGSIRRPRILLVGSAAEYGKPLAADMITREHDCCRPVSAYGISKLTQTHHGLAAANAGLDVTVARLFNPIGAGSPSSTALGSFVRQIAAMNDRGGLLKTGALHAIRDFIDVAEAARVIVKLPRINGAQGRIFNVCTGVGTRLDSIVSSLIEASGIPVAHKIEDSRHGTSDLDTVVGSNERLRQLGVDVSKPNLKSILRDMLTLERSNLQRSSS